MKLHIIDNYLVEAFRHDEYLDMQTHFIDECGWSEKQFSEIEDYDFYAIEIVVTDLSDLSKKGTAYLGACCSPNWKEDVNSSLGGYLPQLIDDAIEDAKQ